MDIRFTDLEIIKELKVSLNLTINSLDEIKALNRIFSIANDLFEHYGMEYNELKWLSIKLQKNIEQFITDINNKYNSA